MINNVFQRYSLKLIQCLQLLKNLFYLKFVFSLIKIYRILISILKFNNFAIFISYLSSHI
jgi:hypothetical protein